jgi:transcriptional regulator of acetoin/glycerol metabolism
MQSIPDIRPQLAVERVIRTEDLAFSPMSGSHRTEQPSLGPKNLNLDAVILDHVRYVLHLSRGNKLRAARQLGISRSTLYRILGQASIHRP